MTPPASHFPRYVIAAHHVLPVGAPPITPGFVAVRDGRIAVVAGGPPPDDLGPVLDYGAAAILPGFVDAHTHLGCAFLRDVASDVGFVEWITDEVAPRVIAAVRHEPDRIVEGARRAAREVLAAGITAVGDSFLHPAGRAAMTELGIRGTFFREFFGSMEDDLPAYIEGVRAQVASDVEEDSDLVRGGLAPHSPYTCPRDVLVALAAEAEARDLPVTIHLDESPDEHRFFTESSGPLFEKFARDGRADRYSLGRTPTRALEDVGALGPRWLLVHAVQLTADDVETVAASGASVVHCPSSNMRLGLGIAPVADMLERGIDVALGTDSHASTGKLDMFEEMRLAILGQRVRRGGPAGMTAGVALDMATRCGARVLGLETGVLAPGVPADMAVVRLDTPRHVGFVDPVSAVVWSSTPADVAATFVGGRLRAGEIPT